MHTRTRTHAHGQTGSRRPALGLWRTSLAGGCPLPSLPLALASHLPGGQDCPAEASLGWAHGGGTWLQGVGSRERTDPGCGDPGDSCAAEWLGEVMEHPALPHTGASSWVGGFTSSALELHVIHARPCHLALGAWKGLLMGPESPLGQAWWGRPSGPSSSCYSGSWSDAWRIKDTPAPPLTLAPMLPWAHGDTLLSPQPFGYPGLWVPPSPSSGPCPKVWGCPRGIWGSSVQAAEPAGTGGRGHLHGQGQ